MTPASTTEPTRRRSFTSSGLSYALVAEELELRLCTGCSDPLERSHSVGFISYPPHSDRTIHWDRTRVSKKGLYQFLLLASWLVYPETREFERWLSLYEKDRHARRLARIHFRMRFPKSFGKRDKARARLDLASIRSIDTEFPEQRELIRRVKTWTRS